MGTWQVISKIDFETWDATNRHPVDLISVNKWSLVGVARRGDVAADTLEGFGSSLRVPTGGGAGLFLDNVNTDNFPLHRKNFYVSFDVRLINNADGARLFSTLGHYQSDPSQLTKRIEVLIYQGSFTLAYGTASVVHSGISEAALRDGNKHRIGIKRVGLNVKVFCDGTQVINVDDFDYDLSSSFVSFGTTIDGPGSTIDAVFDNIVISAEQDTTPAFAYPGTKDIISLQFDGNLQDDAENYTGRTWAKPPPEKAAYMGSDSKFGQAFQFGPAGANAGAMNGQGKPWEWGTKNWIIQFWERPDLAQASNYSYVGLLADSSDNGKGILMRIVNGNAYQFIMRKMGGGEFGNLDIGGHDSADSKTWVHRRIIRQGDKVYAWRKGKFVGSLDLPANAEFAPNDSFTIGRYPGTSNTYSAIDSFYMELDSDYADLAAHAAAGFTPPPAPHTPPKASGPSTSHLKFENGLTDEVSGNTWMMGAGASVVKAPGMVDNGYLDLSKTGSLITCQNADLGKWGNKPFFISFIAQMPATLAEEHFFTQRRTAADVAPVDIIVYADGRLKFEVNLKTGGKLNYTTLAGKVKPNEVYEIAICGDPTTTHKVYFFVDGKLLYAPDGFSQAVADPVANFGWGTNDGVGDKSFNGFLDECIIMDTAQATSDYTPSTTKPTGVKPVSKKRNQYHIVG